MPLIIAPSGKEFAIVRIGGDERVRKHLESLGLTIEERITVLSSKGNGVIIKVKESRLALDPDIAASIFVA